MPFFFVFVGILLILTGVKDTYVALGNQLQKDFTGERNFFIWVLALGSVGALGYVDALKPLSRAFLVLIIIAMILTNSNRGDILTMIADGLNNPVTPPRPTSTTSNSGSAVPRALIDTTAPLPALNLPQNSETKLDKGLNYLNKGAEVLGKLENFLCSFSAKQKRSAKRECYY